MQTCVESFDVCIQSLALHFQNVWNFICEIYFISGYTGVHVAM